MAHPNAIEVNLSDIEDLDIEDLKKEKLDAIENSCDSFKTQLESRFNPIALDMRSNPYKVLDGRHRILLCRQKGYSSILAISA